MKSYLFNRFNIGIVLASLLLIVTEGCSNDADDSAASGSSHNEETSEAVVRVPITIALGGYDEDGEDAANGDSKSSAETTTRTAPPGAGSSTPANSTTRDDNGYEETTSINTIRVIAFRRKAKTEHDAEARSSEDTEGFEYDPKNDFTLTTLTDEGGHTDDYLSGTSHKHRVAKGTFAKSQGYEYRIVAIAYDSEEAVPYPCYTNYKVVDRYMKLNIGKGTTYDEFNATFGSELIDADTKDKNSTSKETGNWQTFLTGGDIVTRNTANLSKHITTIPQLFYGYIYNKGDETQNPIIPYSTYDDDDNAITNTPLVGTLYRGMAEVVLTIDNVERTNNHNPSWACLMADNVLTAVSLTSYDGFKQASTPIVDKYTAIAYSTTSVGASTTLKAYLLPGKTHLALRMAGLLNLGATYRAYNGQIQTKDVTSSDQATGVISVDAINNVFYLRRNHKYVFHCTKSSLIMDHEID